MLSLVVVEVCTWRGRLRCGRRVRGRGGRVLSRAENAAGRDEPQRGTVPSAHHDRPGFVVGDDILALSADGLLRLGRGYPARLLRLLLRNQPRVDAPGRGRHTIVGRHAGDQRAHVRGAISRRARTDHVGCLREGLLGRQLLLKLELLLLLLLLQEQLGRLPARCLLRSEQLL